MSIEMSAKINVNVDTSVFVNIPDQQVTSAIGNCILRFSFWNCDEINITNDGKKGDLIAYFRKDGETRFVLGVVWRPEEGKYTYHS